LRAVNESKRVCSRGSARTPLGELTALPQTPSWIWGKGGERIGLGRGREWEGKGKGRRGRGGREGKGEGRKGERKVNPPSKNSGYGLEFEASITVILARQTKFSTTINSKKVSANKSDIDGQLEIAMCMAIQTGNNFISDSMTDITTIRTANLGFSNRVSSQKESTSDWNIERQPEIAIWTPTPEIVIQLELQQIASTFQR